MAVELFDTHCHLNLPDLFPDPDAEIARAQAAGVTRLALVGIDLESSRRAVEIAERHPGVYAIVGWHPNSASQYSREGLDRIERLFDSPKTIALGEIGLDYHWEFATRGQQRICLEDQLEMASQRGWPVVFHCREAYDDLLELLVVRAPGRYLFHCFAGNAEQARLVRRLDGWIGVDGPLTYRKANELREIVCEWPRERLVLETDSPYLTPEPHRGKPNHPALLPLVNGRLAALWEITPDEASTQTTANAIEFFRLAKS